MLTLSMVCDVFELEVGVSVRVGLDANVDSGCAIRKTRGDTRWRRSEADVRAAEPHNMSLVSSPVLAVVFWFPVNDLSRGLKSSCSRSLWPL